MPQLLLNKNHPQNMTMSKLVGFKGYRKLFYGITYTKERKIFRKEFAGIFPNVNFDDVKFPDKSSIKKYLKEGACKYKNYQLFITSEVIINNFV